jgi:hypothetical protein
MNGHFIIINIKEHLDETVAWVPCNNITGRARSYRDLQGDVRSTMDVVVCIIHFIADDSIMRSLHEMFPLFPQLFLCLSQACLGKTIGFT